MSVDRLQPEIIVFAGPNGSGKSTVTKLANKYWNSKQICDLTGIHML